MQGVHLQGVHLSPLGFAACQSKKCTNQDNGVTSIRLVHFYSVGAVLAWLVHLGQVHPLSIPLFAWLVHFYLVGAVETTAPPKKCTP